MKILFFAIALFFAGIVGFSLAPRCADIPDGMYTAGQPKLGDVKLQEIPLGYVWAVFVWDGLEWQDYCDMKVSHSPDFLIDIYEAQAAQEQ